MGNFSRDTYRLTNAAHRLVTGEAVTDPRHYVGVRVQQGVPVLDADWNELDEIRRREHEITVRELIGDGVPGLGDGFSIGPVEHPNDFIVRPGLLVLGGWQVINLEPRRYSVLPRFFDEDGAFTGVDLTTPGSERIDLVYLDVWEEEVAGSGPGADPRLVNEVIGIETAVRIERRWTVRVAEGTTDVVPPGAEAGHKYLTLARFYRTAAASILPSMIEDRRRLGLTLATALRAPLLVRRGSDAVDGARFTHMLTGLRETLAGWQEGGRFPVALGTTEEHAAFQNALNRIYYLATAGEVATLAGSLDNAAALAVLSALVDAQAALVSVVRDLGTGTPDEMAPIGFYEMLLEGSPPNGIGGVRPRIAQDDLLGAVRAQEELTTWLGLATGAVPQGSVSCVLASADPPVAIQPGERITLTYAVTSGLIIPAGAVEIFDLQAETTDAQWVIELPVGSVSLAPGESADVTLLVTPAGALGVGAFTQVDLVARARRRTSIQSAPLPVQLTIGSLPPSPVFFFYSGGVPLDAGTLRLGRADVEQETFEIFFTLLNTAAPADEHTFRINYELVWPAAPPAGIDPTEWIPSAPQTVNDFNVTGSERSLPINFRAPSLAGVTEDVSVELHATATLVAVDGVPVADGKINERVLPMVVGVA